MIKTRNKPSKMTWWAWVSSRDQAYPRAPLTNMQQVLRGSWPLYRASCHQRVQLLAFGCRYSHARLLCHESSKSQLRNDQSLSESRPNRAEDGKISLFGRIRQLGWTFWNGTKALMKDQKTAVQLALSSRFDQLNRKEKEFIRNVRWRWMGRQIDWQTDGQTDRRTE